MLKLKDGIGVPVQLTFKDLYKLEKDNPELAEEYFNLQAKDKLNELDMVKVVYIGYLCAGNEKISFEDFLDKISNNRNETLSVYYDLIYPKN